MNQTQQVNLRKLKSVFELKRPTKSHLYYDKDLPICFSLNYNDRIEVFPTEELFYIMHIYFKNPFPTLQEEDLKDIIIAINDYFLNPTEFETIDKYI